MKTQKEISIDTFLSGYGEQISLITNLLRTYILTNLPNIKEELDIPAKIIMYTYGPRYIDLFCNIIPSNKGLKLGFNQGVELPDPSGLLQGTGKISRYVEIKSHEEIKSPALKKLIKTALKLYKERVDLDLKSKVKTRLR